MRRRNEKADFVYSPVMTLLSYVSIAAVALCSASFALTLPWQFNVYAVSVNFVFDGIFTYEFFYRLIKGGDKLGVLAALALSSLIPLAFVSGPCIASWLSGDMYSPAALAFCFGPNALGLFATLAALRLIRLARPFRFADRRYTNAALAFFTVSLLGALAADAYSAPGISRAAERNRLYVMACLREAGGDDERAILARSIRAELRKNGALIQAAPEALSPLRSLAKKDGAYELVFDVSDESAARGYVSFIISVAALCAAACYALAHTRGRSKSIRHSASRHAIRERPTGSEELQGILGKKTV